MLRILVLLAVASFSMNAFAFDGFGPWPTPNNMHNPLNPYYNGGSNKGPSDKEIIAECAKTGKVTQACQQAQKRLNEAERQRIERERWAATQREYRRKMQKARAIIEQHETLEAGVEQCKKQYLPNYCNQALDDIKNEEGSSRLFKIIAGLFILFILWKLFKPRKTRKDESCKMTRDKKRQQTLEALKKIHEKIEKNRRKR